jgi:hypothetical protein
LPSACRNVLQPATNWASTLRQISARPKRRQYTNTNANVAPDALRRKDQRVRQQVRRRSATA